jgi:hypothetical protein
VSFGDIKQGIAFNARIVKHIVTQTEKTHFHTDTHVVFYPETDRYFSTPEELQLYYMWMIMD